jgi:condensin complex subunit 2
VKIYSLRVDSVHSEAYKVLGGINRAGRGEGAGKDPLNIDMDSFLLLF